MGGPTAHPTGVTLALGDPPNSLNAPGGSLGYLSGQGAQGFVPWVVLERVPGPVVATGAAVAYGRDSGMRSGLPHHRGSIKEASYLAVGVEGENMGPRRHNQGMESGQGGRGAVVLWPGVVVVWLKEREQANWLGAKRLAVAGQPLPRCLVGQRTQR